LEDEGGKIDPDFKILTLIIGDQLSEEKMPFCSASFMEVLCQTTVFMVTYNSRQVWHSSLSVAHAHVFYIRLLVLRMFVFASCHGHTDGDNSCVRKHMENMCLHT
jgi:hypothetical protein